LLYFGIIEDLKISHLDTGIGIYNGLFHFTATSHSFGIFIYIIAPIILSLTAFYAKCIVQLIRPYNRFIIGSGTKLKNVYIPGYVKAYRTGEMGIGAPQFTILEYPLIILFTLIGAILLMSSSDLLSPFLAIDFQNNELGFFVNDALNPGTLVNSTIVLANKDVENQKSSKGVCVSENRLHSYYVTGFLDGESCFYARISKNKKSLTG
jgi:hypothetical protein